MTRSKDLFAALILLAGGTSNAQYTPPDPGGFEGIIVETYYVSNDSDATDTDGSNDLAETGETTYRVFVDLLPGYKLLIVSGFVNHDLTFNTTTTFFDNDDRGEAWGRDINDAFLDLNSVAIDSWLTMGAASDAHWGVLKTEDTDGSIVGGANNDGGSLPVPGGMLVNFVPSMGVPLTTADGLLVTGTPPPPSTTVGTPPTIFSGPGGSSFSSDNFAWGVLGGIEGPTAENKILIGQFTTDGTLTFCLNLWVLIPDSLVCSDPNCHDILEFYGTLLPSDTAGGGFATDNRFTHPTMCFDSSSGLVDCLGVPGGAALPGTPCDDGNADTQNDVYDPACACVGEDCLGVLGGNALPGQPCDDGNSSTVNDTWQVGCICSGTVGVEEAMNAGVMVIVHPNPVRDLLSIQITGMAGTKAAYVLNDALGRTVASRDLGLLSGSWNGSLDMSSLTRGIYFLEFTGDGVKHIERITKY